MSAVCLCLLCGRALNVLEPRQWGIVLDSLSRGQIPTSAALLLVLYRWIDSSVVGPFRRWLWEPVELNAEASMKTASYNHIMGLSRDFHTEKQSGELYESIEQGTTIISLLHLVLFQLLPLIVDLAVAFAYLYYVFGSYMALIVAATTAIYLGTSNCLIGYQTKLRRRVQGLSRKGYQLMYDTMGGWNTVTYFNRLNYEKEVGCNNFLHIQDRVSCISFNAHVS